MHNVPQLLAMMSWRLLQNQAVQAEMEHGCDLRFSMPCVAQLLSCSCKTIFQGAAKRQVHLCNTVWHCSWQCAALSLPNSRTSIAAAKNKHFLPPYAIVYLCSRGWQGSSLFGRDTPQSLTLASSPAQPLTQPSATSFGANAACFIGGPWSWRLRLDPAVYFCDDVNVISLKTKLGHRCACGPLEPLRVSSQLSAVQNGTKVQDTPK